MMRKLGFDGHETLDLVGTSGRHAHAQEPTIQGVWCPNHQTASLQCVNEVGYLAFVSTREVGQLLLRAAWLLNAQAQKPQVQRSEPIDLLSAHAVLKELLNCTEDRHK